MHHLPHFTRSTGEHHGPPPDPGTDAFLPPLRGARPSAAPTTSAPVPPPARPDLTPTAPAAPAASAVPLAPPARPPPDQPPEPDVAPTAAVAPPVGGTVVV